MLVHIVYHMILSAYQEEYCIKSYMLPTSSGFLHLLHLYKILEVMLINSIWNKVYNLQVVISN
jgi:hypothetical protein